MAIASSMQHSCVYRISSDRRLLQPLFSRLDGQESKLPHLSDRTGQRKNVVEQLFHSSPDGSRPRCDIPKSRWQGSLFFVASHILTFALLKMKPVEP